LSPAGKIAAIDRFCLRIVASDPYAEKERLQWVRRALQQHYVHMARKLTEVHSIPVSWVQCEQCSKWRKLALEVDEWDGEFTSSM
jgi:hypothetical protein